jgi:hypothetical protein
MQTYHGNVARSPLNDALGVPPTSVRDAVCSVIDPVIATMLLLATDGVSVDRISAPEKLNQARVKAGKAAIPAHWRVHTAEYVAALTQIQ